MTQPSRSYSPEFSSDFVARRRSSRCGKGDADRRERERTSRLDRKRVRDRLRIESWPLSQSTPRDTATQLKADEKSGLAVELRGASVVFRCDELRGPSAAGRIVGIVSIACPFPDLLEKPIVRARAQNKRVTHRARGLTQHSDETLGDRDHETLTL